MKKKKNCCLCFENFFEFVKLICKGQRFAMMEEKTVIAWVLRYFDIKAVHRRDQIRPKGDLILRPTEGIYLELNLRRSIANLDEILSESK